MTKHKKVRKENAKYILTEEDIEEFQVLCDCLAALYKEEQEAEGGILSRECNIFVKKKIAELGSSVKSTPNLKSIQVQNLRTSNSIHLFAFNKTIDFIERFVDKRISMVLRLVYNSTSANFEALGDLIGDLIKSGKIQVI